MLVYILRRWLAARLCRSVKAVTCPIHISVGFAQDSHMYPVLAPLNDHFLRHCHSRMAFLGIQWGHGDTIA